MTREEADYLVEVLQGYIDSQLNQIKDRGKISVHQFEKAYMQGPNGGLPLDQAKFRLFLRECAMGYGIANIKVAETLPSKPEKDTLYIIGSDGSYSLNIWSNESDSWVNIPFDPFSTEVVDALPTEDISARRIYLVKRDGRSRFEVVGEKREDNFTVLKLKELMDINGLSTKETVSLYNSLPAVISRFADRESAEAEAAKYKVLPVSVRENKDIYDEYVYVDGSFELLGADMGKYYTKEESDERFGNVQEIPLREVVSVKECTREEWNAGMVDLGDRDAKFVVSEPDGSHTIMAWKEGAGWTEEDARFDTLYISDSTSNMYKMENGDLSLIGNDGTLYIRSLDELNDKTGYGSHKVVWIEKSGIYPNTHTVCSAWTLYVNRVTGRGSTTVSQVLSNDSGYYARTGKQPAGGDIVWDAWHRRTYAYSDDIRDGKLTVKLNSVKAATFTANQASDTVVNLDAAANMPDFAWWQKRTANRGASVLVTSTEIRPAELNKNGDLNLPLLEIGSSAKNVASATEWDFTDSFTIPKNVTNLWFENFGLSERAYGDIDFTFRDANGDAFTATVGMRGKSTYAIALPDGWAGRSVSGLAEFTWQSGIGTDFKFPRRLRIYADAKEVLTSGIHTYYDYYKDEWIHKTEWAHLGIGKFGLLRYDWDKGRWVVLRTTGGAVRVKRHFLECRIANGRIDRTTWRTFDRPTGCDPNRKDRLWPTFVRACTRGGKIKIFGVYTGKRRKRVMRWLSQGGMKSNTRTRYFARETDLTALQINRSMPFGKVMYSAQVYLDTLFAETRGGNRRPFVKTLCARWRKCMKTDTQTFGVSFVGWKFVGFSMKPFRQF